VANVTRVVVEDVAQYVLEIGRFEHRHVAQWFFRGHSRREFQLIPSLFRLDASGMYRQDQWDGLEEYMMQSFKCEATPYLVQQPEDELDWLSLAQHHGLPTRLLDWSTNPLMALFFSVERDSESDADVWCFGFPSTYNCQSNSTYAARRLSLRRIGVVYFPRHLSPRVTNQSGCFTYHTSASPLNEEKELDGCEFVRIQIPSQKKSEMLDQLYNLGIHRGLIFPGLEGIAERLKYEVTQRNFRHTRAADG
jgi:hypothetical protein